MCLQSIGISLHVSNFSKKMPVYYTPLPSIQFPIHHSLTTLIIRRYITLPTERVAKQANNEVKSIYDLKFSRQLKVIESSLATSSPTFRKPAVSNVRELHCCTVPNLSGWQNETGVYHSMIRPSHFAALISYNKNMAKMASVRTLEMTVLAPKNGDMVSGPFVQQKCPCYVVQLRKVRPSVDSFVHSSVQSKTS